MPMLESLRSISKVLEQTYKAKPIWGGSRLQGQRMPTTCDAQRWDCA